MPTTIQLRRGTATQHDSFTGSVGEITVDTTLNTVRVHDGLTVGGTRLVVYNEVADRLQVANANITFETKAVALAANTAQNSLISDRLQVANAAATYSTLTQLGNTNSYIASVQDNINVQIGSSNTSIRTYTDTTYETKAVALAANTAQNNLINDRIQVANAATLFVNVSGDTMSGALAMGSNKITGLGTPTATADAATKSYVDTEVAGIVNSAPETLNTLNELATALGDDANFATTTATSLGTKAANTYVNAQIGASNTSIRAFASQTFETKAVALASNTAQNNLISDRIQVANSRVEFLQSANTTVTSGAGSITTTMNQVDLNDEALVNPAGFLTINIGGTNYKLPFYS